MSGVTHLHKDIVGRVRDVVDTVVLLNQQAVGNLLRRGSDLDIANDARAVPSTPLRIDDLNREVGMELRC
jgi:hypothetical protein